MRPTGQYRHPNRLSPFVRWALLVLGLIAVVLGGVGVFLPVVPTVPFLLLAVACFARSSDRFYRWLLNHARLGPMIRPYLEGRGMKRTSRRKAIALLWISILGSIILLGGTPWLQFLLLTVALSVTCYLLRLPLVHTEEDSGNV